MNNRRQAMASSSKANRFTMRLVLHECSRVGGVFSSLEEMERIWTYLSKQCQYSYFLSWGWIKNWLESLPDEALPQLAVVSDAGIPVCAFFVKRRHVARHGLFRRQSLFLNATGDATLDDVCLEYNQMLCPKPNAAMLGSILEQLLSRAEEVHMQALDADAFPASVLRGVLSPYKVIVDTNKTSPYVDLQKVKRTSGGYLSLLSANTRRQVKRSRTLCESTGHIALEQAGNLAGALRIFDDLVLLHQETWKARGLPGAFASSYFHHFHKRLIRDRFACGEIQLLRVTAGERTIGCLYNFVCRKKVLYYQSGFSYSPDPHLKPGLVCHVEAVEMNANLGHLEYDFLGGTSQLKESLATGRHELLWVRIQQPRIKFCIEECLTRAKRRLLRKS